MTATASAPANTGLILDSLEVENFRSFSHLLVPKIGRVNLITGKNNAGKSSLLEALWLYAERCSPSLLANLLKARNELSALNNVRAQANQSEAQILNIKYLFNGRKSILEEDPSPIRVASLHPNAGSVTMRIEWVEERSGLQDARPLAQSPRPTRRPLRDVVPYVSVQVNDQPPTAFRLDRVLNSGSQLEVELENIPCKYLWPNGLGGTVSRLWDNITFTDLEDDVVSSLRLIAHDIERINLIGDAESNKSRVPVVKLKHLDGPIPLRSLGDGIYRMFGIALTLVTSKNGLLLLDEVESGLHYSVLPDMWRFLFQIARRLNVQVFATTHSWDCIEAFQKASEEDAQGEGVLIRLENKNGDVKATVFDERRLAIVTREQIEVR